MTVVNELTLIAILTFLAERYPDEVEGKEVVRRLGVSRKENLRRCIYYLADKGYIKIAPVSQIGATAAKIASKFVDEAFLDAIRQYKENFVIEKFLYQLTTEGVDYLNGYNQKLADLLSEIRQKPAGFQNE